MLLKIVQSSFRSIYSAELLRTVNLKPINKCRYGTRWTSRKPVAIVNEDEFFDTNDTEKTVTNVPRKTQSHRKKFNQQKSNKQKKEEDEATEVESETDSIKSKYKTLKADDKLISSLMIQVKARNKKEKNQLMLLEGFRLLEDALQAGVKPKVIFFSRLSDVLKLQLPQEVLLYKIPYRTIQLWSNLTTSPGIVGIFDIPDMSDKQPAEDAIPLTIICDNIREPGNLGAIVRCAAAVGCEKLLLMKGCVDLWDSKVLRSAVGAHFRLPILTNLLWDDIPTLISNESRLFLADNNITYENEWNKCTVNPESDKSTSNEVGNNDINKDDADVNINEMSEDNDAIDQVINQTKANKPTTKTKLLIKRLVSQLPVVPYYSLDYTQRETVLIISGETESVSLESYKLLKARNCIRVNVPLTNGVDSLNVGAALGIVTYEMKKQFITRKVDE
ncbi:rRNA methyltransferase 3, mitochondrial [Linepithema humile]|uniref:rRNA methyltransferase 3, mitochondrial n=1 Tax=Linepithema humile TaxID=83485 RepID=UPI000623B49F|nr:PREDICTED: rRNA methyltransferase 3, mitochondrial [Linepithema humile]